MIMTRMMTMLKRLNYASDEHGEHKKDEHDGHDA